MLVDLSAPERIWAVIRSKPRKEAFVGEFLSSRGMEAYCPFTLERGKSGNPRPLFPGYLFARISPRFDLADVRRSPNVLCPLTFSGQLAALEDRVVEGLKSRASSSGVIIVERPPLFRRGDIVKIRKGSFEGLEAVVLEYLPDRERVRLLLDYFGREVRLEAEESLLA